MCFDIAERGVFHAGPVQPGFQQRFCRDRCFTLTQKMGAGTQKALHVPGAAFIQIAPQPVRLFKGKCRMRYQSGIRPGISRQHREKNVFVPRQSRDLLQSVGPVGGAAEQPQDDETGSAKRLFEIEIDRVIMAQRHEVGEA